jgi:tetratricopeptide (TPR) repeat protein
METRRAPAVLKMDSFQDVKNAWDAGTETDGAGFVPLIYHGENPYGAPYNFLTHYSGYLLMPDEKQIVFYTLSSDASFVLVNDQLEFGWPGQHSPAILPKDVHAKAVQCPAGLVKIDYYAAKGAQEFEDRRDTSAMVLGWKGNDDTYSAIPATAWLHPGNTNVGAIVQSNDQPLPLPKVEFASYIGYGDQWLYETTLSLNLKSSQFDGWTDTWEFEDGASVSGSQARRVLVGEKPQFVKLKLTHGDTTLTELARVDFTTRGVTRALVRNADDVQRYVKLMAADTPSQLKPDSLAARLKFLLEWGTDQQVAGLSDAWPQGEVLNDREAGLVWVRARLIALRTHAGTNPKKALEDLNALAPQVQQRFPWITAPLEIDLHVFYLRDADSLGRIGQIAFQYPASDLAKTAKIRAGDLYRMLGRYKEAVAQYQTLGIKADDRSLPAQDRALSIAIRDLLENGYRNEAQDKLGEWERKHPMAKFDSDFLLLRARTLMLFGRWHEALVELESFEKVQPDSPFEIDAEFYRARVLYETGNKEEARKIWTAIAKNYPRHELAPQAVEWRAKP